MEDRKTISALNAGMWIAGGVLFTTWIVYLLRLMTNLPRLLNYTKLFGFHFLAQDVTTGMYVVPASMASGFAVSTAFYFRKNVTITNLKTGFLVFCVLYYIAFVAGNALLDSLDSDLGQLFNHDLSYFLVHTGFVVRFLQPALAFVLVIALTRRRYVRNVIPEGNSSTCSAIFLAAFACFCLEFIVRPHVDGYEGSFMSMFWSAHYDIDIAHRFLFQDLAIIPIGALGSTPFSRTVELRL